MIKPNANWIMPHWDVPKQIKSISTTRHGGVSQAPYASLNLGDHVNDLEIAVAQNRAILKKACNLPQAPIWLNQVHQNKVVQVSDAFNGIDADAITTDQPNQVCAIMTADCLPVLLTNRQGTQVAVAHAGWRGLAKGILQATLATFDCAMQDIIIWFGPAIGQDCFEVGLDVYQIFTEQNKQYQTAFKIHRPNHWLLDIQQLARLILQQQGVQQILINQYCTYSDKARFFSYRRDKVCGRMATLIWIEK